jgi:HAE1 family hydrophobic/amphiphilic exporter-1
MIPLALGSGAGAGSRRTVAIVVIGGQSLCLLLTLLVTPVAYSLAEDFVHAALWRKLAKLLRGSLPRRAAGTAGALLLVLSIAGPLAGQAPPRVGVGQIQRKLTLEEAIAQALASNLDVEIDRTNTAAALAALRGAHGIFDPTFRWLPNVQSRNTPAGSILVGAGGALAEHEHSENFYFNQKLLFNGASFNASFENDRLTSSNPFAGLNPTLTSRLLIQITQPLVRNREIDSGRALLKIRRKQVDMSETQFELRAIDVVSRVELAYWDLVAARQNAQVAAETVELAREQLARNKRMIDAGSLAPVELSASEAELEKRLDDWYAAIGAITEAENALKTLISGDRRDTLWDDEIVPLDERTLAAPDVDDLRQAVARAVQARPELKLLASQQQVNQIEKRQNADLTKPQVNLVAGYMSNGLAGSVRPGENPITASSQPLYDRVNQLSTQAGLPAVPNVNVGGLPGNLLGGYGSTLSNLLAARYPTFQAGLSIDLTFHNQAAEANLAQSAIAERRLKLLQAQAEQTIEAQVRNALQALRTAEQRITAADASARAAQEKLASETRLFQTGESTNFLVLTRQNEYTDARRRSLVAKLDFNKAVARLEQAMGATLESHHITLK